MALAATVLVAGPAVAESARPGPAPCPAPRRTTRSGVDTWNAAYPRPARTPRRGHDLPVVPGLRAAELARRARRRPLPGHQPVLRARLVRQVRPAPASAARSGSGCRSPRPRTGYSATGTPSSAAPICATRSPRPTRTVDFSRYDIVYLVADPDAPGVDSDATKVVNFDRPLHADGTDISRVVTVFEQHPPDRNVLAHETGHVFDLPDLYHRPDGRQGRLGHLRRRLGRDGQPVRAGAGPLRLAQVEAGLAGPAARCAACSRPDADHPGAAGRRARRPAASLGTRLAVVRTGEDTRARRSRRAAPPATTRATCTEGVLVYRVRSRDGLGRRPGRGAWTPTRAPRRAGTGRSTRRSRTRRWGWARRSPCPGERTRVEVADRTRVGRVDGQDHARRSPARTAGTRAVAGRTKKPPARARGFFRLCAARDSNPGPAD